MTFEKRYLEMGPIPQKMGRILLYVIQKYSADRRNYDEYSGVGDFVTYHLRHTYTPLMYKIPPLNAHLGIYGCGTKRGGNHLIFKNIRAKRSKKHQSTLAWPCRAGRTGGGDPSGGAPKK